MSKLHALLLLAVLAVVSIVRADTPAGVINGEFHVNRNGGATYTIAIAAPPGTHNVQPTLSLAYASQSGNGQVGTGWSLGGLSVVSRCKAIIAVDGFAGGVNYDQDDRFCLDGERLININKGPYQATDAVYHTEHEQWLRVMPSYVGCAMGPCSFTVTTSKGTVRNYGTTADSRIIAYGGTAVRAWALSKSTDLRGNSLQVLYSAAPNDSKTGKPISSPGAYYPTRIAYTSNDAAGFAANRFVDFSWTTRPDVAVHYLGGYQVTTSARLSGITTRLASQVVSDYRLVYEDNPATGTGRSRLARIRRCDSTTASANCLPDTVLGSWQTLKPAFTGRTPIVLGSFTANQGWGNEAIYPRTGADVNGDGRTDLIGFGDANATGGFQGVQVSLSQGTTASPSTMWTKSFAIDKLLWLDQTRTPRFLLDVNSDGLADLVGFGSDGVHVGLSTGSRFDTTSWNGGNTFPYFKLIDWDPKLFPRMVADVNGDGLADLVGFKNGVQVAINNNGTTFAAPVKFCDGFSYDSGWDDTTPRVLADVNGDGRADVIGFSKDGVKVALSTGNGCTQSGWDQTFPYFGFNQGWDPKLNPRMVADVNGDGLADIVGFKNGVWVALSTGKGFLPPVQWNTGFSYESTPSWTPEMPRQLSDVNGDGFSDIIGFNANNDGTGRVMVALSTGNPATGFVTAGWDQNSLPNLNPNTGPIMALDVNGQGFANPVNFAADGVYGGYVAGPAPDLLTGFTDGLGAQYTVTYGSLSSGPPLYQATNQLSKDSQAVSAQAHSTTHVPIGAQAVPVFPNRAVLGSNMTVVSSYTVANDPHVNTGLLNEQYTYSYTNAAENLLGRGWLGFEKVTGKHAGHGLSISRSYQQLFPFTGMLASKLTTCDPGKDPLCKSANTVLHQQSFGYLCGAPPCAPSDQAIFNPYPNVYQLLRTAQTDSFYSYGTYNFSLGKSSTYDQWGNKLLATDLNYVDAAGKDRVATDNVYTYTTYSNDPATNQFGRILSRMVSGKQYASWAGGSCTSPPSFETGDVSLQALTYNTTFDILAMCQWDNQNKVWLKSGYGYDDFGNRKSTTDPAGATTTTVYDPTYHAYPATTTSPPDQSGKSFTTHDGYDPRFGTRVARQDMNNNVSTTCVDSFGRTMTKQAPLPDASTPKSANCLTNQPVSGTVNFAAAPVVTMANDSWLTDGQGGIYHRKQMISSWPTASSPAPQVERRRYVDPKNRTYKAETVASTTGQKVYVCTRWSGGKIEARSLPFFSTAATVNCGPSGDAKLWSTTTYDAYKREVKITAPAGADGSELAVNTASYQGTSDGETETYTFADGDVYAYRQTMSSSYFDSQRRLTKLESPAGSGAISTYGYDSLGRPMSFLDPSGVWKRLTYDSMGRKLTVDTQQQGTTSFSYSPTSGRLATRTTPAGSTSFTFDLWGRPLQRVMTPTPDNGTAQTFRFEYDGATCPGGNGRLASMATVDASKVSQVSRSYCYDASGNRTRITTQAAGEPSPFVTDRKFDPLHRLVSLKYPGTSDTMTVSFAGLLLQNVMVGGTSYARYSNYDAAGTALHIEYANGVKQDSRYSPGSVFYGQKLIGPAGTLLDESLTWDHLGEVKTIADSVSGKTQTFAYQAHRLQQSSITGGNPIVYHYDPNGNLHDKGDYTFEYTGQQVTKGLQGGQVVWAGTYDSAGRLSNRTDHGTTWNLTFDPLSRLMSMSQGNGGATTKFLYDPNGTRVQKLDPDGTRTTYISQNFEHVILPNGTTQYSEYVTSPGEVIASNTVASGSLRTGHTGRSGGVVESGVPTPGQLFMHNGYLLSTQATTDGNGQRSASAIYAPYGDVEVSGTNNFRAKFSAKELDSTGLYYFQARYYDPVTGRFVSADTGLGAAHPAQQDALNAYEYALANPTTFADPDGRLAFANVATGVACIGAAAVATAGSLTIYGAKGDPEKTAIGALQITGAVGAGFICADRIRAAVQAARAPANNPLLGNNGGQQPPNNYGAVNNGPPVQNGPPQQVAQNNGPPNNGPQNNQPQNDSDSEESSSESNGVVDEDGGPKNVAQNPASSNQLDGTGSSSEESLGLSESDLANSTADQALAQTSGRAAFPSAPMTEGADVNASTFASQGEQALTNVDSLLATDSLTTTTTTTTSVVGATDGAVTASIGADAAVAAATTAEVTGAAVASEAAPEAALALIAVLVAL